MGIQIVVTHRDNRFTFHTVPEGQGWKVDAACRCLVIGRGVPRTYVPLDGVMAFEVQHVAER